MTAMTTATSPAPAASMRGVAPTRALRAYLRFDFRRALRNRRYALFAIGFPVLFYLLFTGLLLGGAAPDPTWNAFYMVSMMAYGMIGASLSTAIPISQERESGWTRQLRITPLPATAWVATKLLVAYMTSLPALALVGLAAVLVNHVSLPPETWVAVFVSLAIGVLPFTGLGLLIGFVFDAGAAQGAVTISYLGLAILGGLWAPVSTFPATLATIAQMLPTYHFANLAWGSLADGLPDAVDALFVAAYAFAIFALVAWRYRVAEQRAGR
jgi:ABC-2 type transport system permease protein